MAKSKPDPTDLSSLLATRKQQKSKGNRLKNQETVGTERTEKKKKVGRPPGRRSDPNCSPLNLILNEDIINDAKYKLAKLNKGKIPKKSLSDLVEELLEEWLDRS